MTIEILRMIERLLAVTFGGMSLFLGFRLFTVAATAPQKGEITIFREIKIKALQLGPGVFFAAFGAWIVGTSVKTPISISTLPTLKKMAQTQVPETNFSGLGPTTQSEFLPSESIKAINAVDEQSKEYLLSPMGKIAFNAIRALKFDLLRAEYRTSPLLVEEFIRCVEFGLQLPPDKPELIKIKECYEATY